MQQRVGTDRTVIATMSVQVQRSTFGGRDFKEKKLLEDEEEAKRAEIEAKQRDEFHGEVVRFGFKRHTDDPTPWRLHGTQDY